MSVFDETWREVALMFVIVDGHTVDVDLKQRETLAAAAPEMYRALKLAEFEGRDSNDDPCCPLCCAVTSDSHTKNCELAAALKKAEGR